MLNHQLTPSTRQTTSYLPEYDVSDAPTSIIQDRDMDDKPSHREQRISSTLPTMFGGTMEDLDPLPAFQLVGANGIEAIPSDLVIFEARSVCPWLSTDKQPLIWTFLGRHRVPR